MLCDNLEYQEKKKACGAVDALYILTNSRNFFKIITNVLQNTTHLNFIEVKI